MRIVGKMASLALSALIPLTLSACGATSSQEEPAGQHETSKSQPTQKATGKPTPKIGETVENDGIRMKLASASDQPSIAYDSCGDGCSNHEYAQRAADQNAKYWVVTTEITNTGKEPVDLTCSYPLEISAFNSANQEYTPIEHLYQVQGNPECNAQLQPGFTSQMIYPFMVPSGAKMIGLSWRPVHLDASYQTEYSYFLTDDHYELK